MGVLSVPDDLLRRVATAARKRNISVENQAEQLLTVGLLALRESADHRRVSDAERSARISRFQSIRDMTPRDVEQTDSVILLREDRDR